MSIIPGSITSANATFTLSVAGLFTSPQQVQQFAVDDAFDADAIENGEIVKGVDDALAYGWVPTLPKLNVTLMANSESNALFDQWFEAEQEARDKFIAQGIITLPGTRMQYTLIGALLMSYMPIPPAKKTLQARKHTLIMDKLSPAKF